MPTVYLETTIPSYLAAFPSRDLITLAHQQITHEWWQDARHRFEIFISEAVLDEIRSGNPDAIERRLKIVEGVPILQVNDDVRYLVHEYDKRLGIVGRARADLPHFAFAVSYEMDYLLTWNCQHIANGEIIKRLTAANDELERRTPQIITPEVILEFPKEEII